MYIHLNASAPTLSVVDRLTLILEGLCAALLAQAAPAGWLGMLFSRMSRPLLLQICQDLQGLSEALRLAATQVAAQHPIPRPQAPPAPHPKPMTNPPAAGHRLHLAAANGAVALGKPALRSGRPQHPPPCQSGHADHLRRKPRDVPYKCQPL